MLFAATLSPVEAKLDTNEVTFVPAGNNKTISFPVICPTVLLAKTGFNPISKLKVVVSLSELTGISGFAGSEQLNAVITRIKITANPVYFFLFIIRDPPSIIYLFCLSYICIFDMLRFCEFPAEKLKNLLTGISFNFNVI